MFKTFNTLINTDQQRKTSKIPMLFIQEHMMIWSMNSFTTMEITTPLNTSESLDNIVVLHYTKFDPKMWLLVFPKFNLQISQHLQSVKSRLLSTTDQMPRYKRK